MQESAALALTLRPELAASAATGLVLVVAVVIAAVGLLATQRTLQVE